jgi:selenocysteine lyase/cysteine desulfurase
VLVAPGAVRRPAAHQAVLAERAHRRRPRGAVAGPRVDHASANGPTGRLRHGEFFNYVPFTAALELRLELGIDEAARYVDGLVVRLLAGIDRTRFRLVSSEGVRSPLVVVEPLREASAEVFERLTAAGVHVAHRRGRIRISPHLYNNPDEIDRVLELL